ncbi:MAG: M23 family metallopeptidase [Patescibacteria group bacterium]
MQLKKHQRTLLHSVSIVTGIFLLASGSHVAMADDIRNMIYPVIGQTNFSDSFGAPRIGHTHQGIDVFGTKMQQLVAVTSGRLSYVPFPEPSYGYGIFLRGDDGYEYWYLHLNNDNPGTDDGQGGGINAYATDSLTGLPVTKGQLIGYMGDSGNAEKTPPHLHFEIHRPDENVINPFLSLKNASHSAAPIFAPPLPGEILPFLKFQGGASIARGDIDVQTPGEEIIAGAGPGGGPDVRLYNSDKTLRGSFFPFPATFRGGVDVTTGDVNGDGTEEIISGAGPGGGPQVVVSDMHGHRINQFLAYPKEFRGGIRISSADMDGDGVAEIITSPATQGNQPIRVFNRWGELKKEFLAFGSAFTKGLDVTAAPANEFNEASIAVGVGEGGGPQVKVFSFTGDLKAQFFAYDKAFRGGIHLDIGEINSANNGLEIVAVPASHGGPQIRSFDMKGNLSETFTAFEPWWRGGYDIGAGSYTLSISTQSGNRRTSVRDITVSNDAQYYHQPVVYPSD